MDRQLVAAGCLVNILQGYFYAGNTPYQRKLSIELEIRISDKIDSGFPEIALLIVCYQNIGKDHSAVCDSFFRHYAINFRSGRPSCKIFFFGKQDLSGKCIAKRPSFELIGDTL